MMHSSSINYICMERVDNEIMNIWKSYMWTAEWRIIWRSYIRTFCSCEKKAWQKFRLVRDITSMIFLQIILHSAVHFHIFIISSSSFHGFLINEPIQWPAPSWLVSLIGRALHRYRRGQRFESRIEAWIFFRLSFRNCISCVYNCDDPPSNKRVDNHYKLQKKTDNRLHVWIYSRPPITRTFKAKRVRVIESTKQITRSKEMGWAGEECKYHALPTSRAARDIDILDIIQQSWINQYER